MAGKLKGIAVVCGCMALAMVAGCGQKEPTELEKELARLQGQWSPSDDSLRLTISGNTFKVQESEKSVSGSFKVNTESDPKEIDLTCEKSPDKKDVGTTILGIYKVEDDKIVINLGKPDEERPVDIEMNGCIIFTRQSARPEKENPSQDRVAEAGF